MNLPSLETLATLAAVMSSLDEPSEDTAFRALALWNDCRDILGRELQLENDYGSFNEEQKANVAKFSPIFSKKPNWARDEFLREVMPHSKPEDRLEKYRNYWTGEFSGLYKGIELEDAVDGELTAVREKGLSPTQALREAIQFLEYLKRDRKYHAVEKAKKGAAGKKEFDTKMRIKIGPKQHKAGPKHND